MTIAETLISLEKETLAAYKRHDAAAFTKSFGDDYVGVANDGVLVAQDEVTKMMGMQLDELQLQDPHVTFPSDNVAVMTYRMVARGEKVDATIHTSTVYVQRDDRWEAILHTETMAS